MALQVKENSSKRLPPHNLDAEKAVLGAILINPISMNRVVEILETDYFYSPSNRLIYDAMLTLYNQNKPVDALSVSDYFQSKNQLDNIGGAEYLSDLMADTILSSNIEYYANIIKENSIKRKLINAGSNIIEQTYKNAQAQDSLEAAEKYIFDIAQQKSSQDIEQLTNLLMDRIPLRK